MNRVFIEDQSVPTEDQEIVKYVSRDDNWNAHLVECPNGSRVRATMTKKLDPAPGDLLILQPIIALEEKEAGQDNEYEIVDLISVARVIDLVRADSYPKKRNSGEELSKSKLINFFSSSKEEQGLRGERGLFISSVQFMSSGVVTVASVASDTNCLQSLDFETEDSSEESSDFQRQANTIRIQVNYPNTDPDKPSTHIQSR